MAKIPQHPFFCEKKNTRMFARFFFIICLNFPLSKLDAIYLHSQNCPKKQHLFFSMKILIENKLLAFIFISFLHLFW